MMQVPRLRNWRLFLETLSVVGAIWRRRRLVPWPNITPALLLQWTLLLQCSHNEHFSSTRPLSSYYSEHNSYITAAVNKTRSLAQYYSERYFCIPPTVNPTLPLPQYYSKQYMCTRTAVSITCDL